MGRSRRHDRKQLPQYVYRTASSYVYRKYLGKDESGKVRFAPDVRLCSATSSLSEVWTAYSMLDENNVRRDTLEWIVGKYLASDRFKALSESTRRDYQKNAKVILGTRFNGSSTFGKQRFESISPGVIRRYLDYRAATAPVRGNREVSFLQSVFSWGFERDMVRSNPCNGIRKEKESPRTTYVSDETYALVYEVATDYFKVAMELAFLGRMRSKEIRLFESEQIREDGILVRRAKGSKTQIIAWTDRLRSAIALGRGVGAGKEGPYLLNKRGGGPLSAEGFTTGWQRVMDKAVEQNPTLPHFTFHDLKAKGVSDFDGDKHAASGHRSKAMTEVYNRKLEKVDATK